MIHLQIIVKSLGLGDNMLPFAMDSDTQDAKFLIDEQTPFLTAPLWKLSHENIQKLWMPNYQLRVLQKINS